MCVELGTLRSYGILQGKHESKSTGANVKLGCNTFVPLIHLGLWKLKLTFTLIIFTLEWSNDNKLRKNISCGET